MSNDVQLPTDGHLRDVSAGAANVVADHALTSVAVAFCLGVGTGIAVVGMMSLPESTRVIVRRSGSGSICSNR
ncbi:MAG: hypothetical protein R3C10_13750 [Pirellulales bacterium]